VFKVNFQNEFRVKGVANAREKILGTYEFDISDYFGSQGSMCSFELKGGAPKNSRIELRITIVPNSLSDSTFSSNQLLSSIVEEKSVTPLDETLGSVK